MCLAEVLRGSFKGESMRIELAHNSTGFGSLFITGAIQYVQYDDDHEQEELFLYIEDMLESYDQIDLCKVIEGETGDKLDHDAYKKVMAMIVIQLITENLVNTVYDNANAISEWIRVQRDGEV